MNKLKIYSENEILSFVRRRVGEHKLGEKIHWVTKEWEASLKSSAVEFVIVGIAEDIGVRANYGRGGASSAFKPALDSFLNQQDNHFIDAGKICVLGEIEVDDLVERSARLDPKNKADLSELRTLVGEIDARVTGIISILKSMNKIPVIIGGGHNNAYGNIRGCSEALKHKINAINCDPHLDFRPAEGRHSGNGFSYAFNEGFLGKYSVLGMHEQYNTRPVIEVFMKSPAELFFNSYESMFIREEKSFERALMENISFVKGAPCGIELDLDAISNVPSSARTSSGISALQARQFVWNCATQLDPAYLHIAEGAPVLSHIRADNKTGKLIAYLVTDFIKGVSQQLKEE